MKQPQRTSTLHFDLIPEFSWWRTRDGRRLFCVIEKRGRGVGFDYVPTELHLIERGIDAKSVVAYKTFAAQIAEGKLVRTYYDDVYVLSPPQWPRTVFTR